MISARPVRIGALLLFSAALSAQDTPKIEVAVDYSFARYAPSASYTRGHSLNGGGGVARVNFSAVWGIAMDIQTYTSNTTRFSIPPSRSFPHGASGTVSGDLSTSLFGPQCKFRNPGVSPFFSVLLGAARSNVYGNAFKQICQPSAGACSFTVSPGSDAFALAAGGGIDLPFSRRVDIRLGQFDYFYTHFTNKFTNAGQNNFRYLAGLNFNLGIPKPPRY